ncbi:hypothetical protein CE91St41_13840 [Oscillospiraceae bacterium]|nr:hypothetical protein CE91St40_23700 [Oscillospiraceae bacterium]BDF74495.1 hypothetical protein CE91St41_13840 [Oscillospiraceae bacterium]
MLISCGRGGNLFHSCFPALRRIYIGVGGSQAFHNDLPVEQIVFHNQNSADADALLLRHIRQGLQEIARLQCAAAVLLEALRDRGVAQLGPLAIDVPSAEGDFADLRQRDAGALALQENPKPLQSWRITRSRCAEKVSEK